MKNDISISGTWGDIVLMCNYRHEEPVEMALQQGPSSLFYACPKYKTENRTEDERACNNRLNLVDFENMLKHLDGIRCDCELKNEKTVLANYQWKDKKGTEFKVLKHEGDMLTIGVVNWQAIRK
jgi:hypothetical protein